MRARTHACWGCEHMLCERPRGGREGSLESASENECTGANPKSASSCPEFFSKTMKCRSWRRRATAPPPAAELRERNDSRAGRSRSTRRARVHHVARGQVEETFPPSIAARPLWGASHTMAASPKLRQLSRRPRRLDVRWATCGGLFALFSPPPPPMMLGIDTRQTLKAVPHWSHSLQQHQQQKTPTIAVPAMVFAPRVCVCRPHRRLTTGRLCR